MTPSTVGGSGGLLIAPTRRHLVADIEFWTEASRRPAGPLAPQATDSRDITKSRRDDHTADQVGRDRIIRL